MPILQSEITFKLTGGASNADPNASLGGVPSSVSMASEALHNLFDPVSGRESAAGLTEYRCIYVKNENPTLTFIDAEVRLTSQASGSHNSVEIGIDETGVSVASETEAPAGVAFTSSLDPIPVGDIAPGQGVFVWLKRVVQAGAPALNLNGTTIQVTGETAE